MGKVCPPRRLVPALHRALKARPVLTFGEAGSGKVRHDLIPRAHAVRGVQKRFPCHKGPAAIQPDSKRGNPPWKSMVTRRRCERGRTRGVRIDPQGPLVPGT